MPAPITTQLTICNSALLKIGGDIIGSITQNTRGAIVCNTLYNYLRDEVMGESPWRFATKQAVLYPNGTTPAFTYTYQYDIPNDCLRLLVPDDDSIFWVVQGNEILSNEPTLNMNYLYRNTDESSWDARFCEAFAWRLAMELALSLTRSIPMKQEAEKSYNAALAQARAMNAVIGTLPPLEADIWSNARRGNKWWLPSMGQNGDP
jgi:hypothetical protein